MSHARPASPPAFVLAAAAALVAVGAAGGCAHGSAWTGSPGELGEERGWIKVEGVAMIRQSSDHDCGAAALAMMLSTWGTPYASSSADILTALSVGPDDGISAGALRDIAQRRGLHASLIKGEIDDLVREIRLHRPVLVGLVQHYADGAHSHYEVVVGINPGQRRVLLLDPTHGPREDGFDGFVTEWNRADRLAMIAAPPPVAPG